MNIDADTLKKVKEIHNKILSGGNVSKEERKLLNKIAGEYGDK